MKTASPIPAPPQYGVVQRLKAAIMHSTADLPPTLKRLASKLGLTTASSQSAPARKPITGAIAAKEGHFRPKERPLAPSTADHTLTAEDMAIVEAWDKQLSSMSEDERDTFVAAIARQIEGTVKEEPPLTLDQQFAALTSTEERSVFVKVNRRAILAH